MFNSFIGTGLLLMGAAFVCWLIEDQGNALPIQNLDVILFLAGGLLVGIHIFGYVMQTVNAASIAGKRGKCVRCGKKTLKGEIYCAKHMKKVREEFREATRRH